MVNMEQCIMSVSYTHLDVYKRQEFKKRNADKFDFEN